MQRRTAYELSQSQVSTPPEVVEFFWQIVHERRSRLGAVLDLGAGDCRFAKRGEYDKYVGVEIDPARARHAVPPSNGRLHRGCAFDHNPSGYDACIGNPPYVRHHDIESPWKDRILERITHRLGVKLNRKANLFVYFLCLAALKTRDDGIIAMVIPHEWVSRPSVKALRHHIHQAGWSVDVYRFVEPVFEGVLTTASISVIDKAQKTGEWRYFDVSPEHCIRRRRGPSRSGARPIAYEKRGPIWAMRGLSPGSQKFFTLTEGERVHNGLSRRDVIPCVTSLRHVPHTLHSLTQTAFEEHYVDAGARCWLLRSYAQRISLALQAYLESAPADVRGNYTCRNRDPWFAFNPPPIPQILLSSGFVGHGPKVVRNLVEAHSIGAVSGVHVPRRYPITKLQDYLRSMNFARKVVGYAKSLKKLEIGQVNCVLSDFARQCS